MINEMYLDEQIREEMRKSFEDQGVLLLPDFFSEEMYDQITRQISGAEITQKIIPDAFSYSEVNVREPLSGFSSEEFLALVRAVTGKNDIGKLDVMQFTHRNYTLMHDKGEQGDEIVFCFFISDDEWQHEWGGQVVYTDFEQPQVVLPQRNALFIVRKTKDMQDFVKYVNHLAGEKRFVMVRGHINS